MLVVLFSFSLIYLVSAVLHLLPSQADLLKVVGAVPWGQRVAPSLSFAQMKLITVFWWFELAFPCLRVPVQFEAPPAGVVNGEGGAV